MLLFSSVAGALSAGEIVKKHCRETRNMSDPNKIRYEHLKDYPASAEGFHKIANRAVAAAAWAHKPEVAEASPEEHAQPQIDVEDS
jgi:hypothetical protein